MRGTNGANAGKRAAEHDHLVQFYESEAYLKTAVAGFLANGFNQGNAMIVIASPEHQQAFAECLRAEGFDLDAAIAARQFMQFGARETLEKFMTSDLPDPARFAATIRPMIEGAWLGREHLPVLAYGEMVDVLWRNGQCEAAIRLEELWNDLISRCSIKLLCAYAINGFYKEIHHSEFEQICRTHSKVRPTERYQALDETERGLEIASLQQRSVALEAEIQQRKEIESALLQALDDRRKNEHKLRKTERELRSLLEGAAEGLHWVGPDGSILWANRAELELVGYEAEEFVGRNIREFHADADVAEDVLERLSRGEALRNYEARLRCKDGSIRQVLINCNALWDEGKFVHAQCFTRDVTELKLAEALQPFFTSIVDSADDAIISKTLKGIVTSWNPGAERVFGYTAAEMIGKPIAIMIPADRPDEEPRILEKLCRGERIEHYETLRVRKDGKLIHISLTVSPIKDNQGRIIGASKIARDITGRKRIEAELNHFLVKEQSARSQAEAASRLKDEFLAVLSHELRTPLNAILGWTSILTSHEDKELQRRAIDVIQRNAEIQKRLIEDLLDMSGILSGKLVIRTEPVDLAAVIVAAIDSVRPAASAKTIAVDLQIGRDVQHVIGDADRLQQVVWNLLSNSVKFTPPGGHVQIRVTRTAAGIDVAVQDTGKGVALEFLPFVFDRFRQAEQGTARQHGGLGLGLAVVRHLVELHGGTVSADSPGEGLGAAFTVHLPVPETPALEPVPEFADSQDNL